MSIDLGRRLMVAGIVSAEDVEAALFLSVVRGIPFARALLDRGAVGERAIEEELSRRGGLALRNVVAVPELMAKLPRALCRRLGAVPVRLDKYTGTVDVAAADPLDPHVATELGFHLGAPIRVIRAPMTSIEEALRRLDLEEAPAAKPVKGRSRRETPAFPHGAPRSTIPPPPSIDSPILLVRRPPALLEEAPSSSPPEPEAAPPRRDTLRIGSLSRADQLERAEGAEALDGSREPPPRRAAVFKDPAGEPPRVSFPSSRPPPPRDSRPAALAWPAGSAPARATPAMRPPPLTSTGPPPAAPDSSAPAVLQALRDAPSRDAVVRHALRGLRAVAERVAVFAVKRDGYQGWACNVAFGDEEALRRVKIPHDQPSLLATAAAAGTYLGPVPATPVHASLLEVMERASADVAAVAVRAGGRVAMIFVADDLDDTMRGTRRMDALARAAGEALARLVASRS